MADSLDKTTERAKKSSPDPEYDEAEVLEEQAGRGQEDRSDSPLPPEADPHPDLPGDA